MELALAAGLFVAALVIFWIKARDAKRVFESAHQQLEPTVRPLALVSGAIIVVVAIALSFRGVDPPAALVIALPCGAGLFLTGIGLLRMEGLLFEAGSKAEWRQAQGLPPPSSVGGRIATIVIGIALLGAAAWVYAELLVR
jgi:hypothetical protein